MKKGIGSTLDDFLKSEGIYEECLEMATIETGSAGRKRNAGSARTRYAPRAGGRG